MSRDESYGKRLKYNYLTQNNSLNKTYLSPQKNTLSIANSVEEFSPFRNNPYHHKAIQPHGLKDMMAENKLLNTQIAQLSKRIAQLQEQLNIKTHKLKLVEETLSNDRNHYQKLIADMKMELQTVNEHKKALEDNIKRVSNKSKDKYPPKEDQTTLKKQLSILINKYQHKLTDTPHSTTLFSNRVKTEEEIKQFIEGTLRRNHTLQQFRKSIVEMYRKIELKRYEGEDLKWVWKWLKKIGQQHNYLKKITKPLSEYLGVGEQVGAVEMIDRLLVAHLNITI